MICTKEKCTGCYACYNICPQNAIKMEKDENGNVYPIIIKEKCIDCGMCKRVCFQLKDKIPLRDTIKVFAMYNKNEKKRKESSSGGAASTFCESILNNGGIVYGVSNLFGSNEIKFIRVDNNADLYKIKGSKYVHAYVKDIFKAVKKDLLEKKVVLFIGTPCQVLGLKSFLIKDYNNLITIDIICHGVPSQKLLFDEIKLHGFAYREISYVYFRDDKKFNFRLLDKNKNILLEMPAIENDYYKNFLEGNFYRENCYDCRFAQRKRISDVTIGDFWGLDKNSKIYDDEKKRNIIDNDKY